MPKFRVSLSNGSSIDVDAADERDASIRALNLAGDGPKMSAAAPGSAEPTGPPEPFREKYPRPWGVGDEVANLKDWTGLADAALMASGPSAVEAVGPLLARGIVPAAKVVGTGLAGGTVGAIGGKWVGGQAESLGAPQGTQQALALLGGLAGAPIAIGKGLPALRAVAEMTGGQGTLGRLLNFVRPAEAAAESMQAGKAAAEAVAPKAAPASGMSAAEARAAAAAQRAERHAAQMERIRLQNELLKRRVAGKAPLNESAPAPAPEPAPEPVPEVAPPAAEPVQPNTAPFEYRPASKTDIPTIAQQIQQRTDAPVDPTGTARQAVAESLSKMNPSERAAAEAAIAQRQGGANVKNATPGSPTGYQKPAVNPGAAEQFQKMKSFIQEVYPEAKSGEKIWLEIDANGNPTRILGPSDRPAAGFTKTFVRALWGKGSPGLEAAVGD